MFDLRVCICLLVFVLDSTFYITYTLHNLTPIESQCKLNNCFIGRHFYKSWNKNAHTVWYLRESLNKEFELLIMQTRNYQTKMYTIRTVNVKSIKKELNRTYIKSHSQKIEVTLQSLKLCRIWNSTSDIFSRRVKDLLCRYKSLMWRFFVTWELIWNTNYLTNYAWKSCTCLWSYKSIRICP